MDYPRGWDQAESEYNRHYDPYDEGQFCDRCEAEERDFCICQEEE